MLLQNITLYNQYPGRQSAFQCANERNQSGLRAQSELTRFVGASGYNNIMSTFESIPRGYTHTGGALLLSRTAGGMSTANEMVGSGTFTGAGSLGMNVSAYLSGSSTLTFTIGALGNFSTALSGLGEIAASIAGAVKLYANLSGGSNVLFNIAGGGTLNSNLSGIGSITNPTLNALVNIYATVSGNGDITTLSLASGNYITSNLSGDSTLVASFANTPGWIQCHIYVNEAHGQLTAADVAVAVWNELAASHISPVTMGGKMNAAGTAGDPWTANLSGYPSGTAGGSMNQVVSNSNIIPALL